jgi:hypothetical protein
MIKVSFVVNTKVSAGGFNAGQEKFAALPVVVWQVHRIR